MIYKYANYRYSAGTTCIHANIQQPPPTPHWAIKLAKLGENLDNPGDSYRL